MTTSKHLSLHRSTLSPFCPGEGGRGDGEWMNGGGPEDYIPGTQMTPVLIGKGLDFGGLTFKNRGQLGSRYIYIYVHVSLTLQETNRNPQPQGTFEDEIDEFSVLMVG